MNRPAHPHMMLNGHLATCGDYCAKVHCPCGNDATHGVKFCNACAEQARGRLTPNLDDGPGIRLALRTYRHQWAVARRAQRNRRRTVAR